MTLKLEGKTALITGGSSGIGLATASLFLAEGARVAITGRCVEGLEKASCILGKNVLVYASDTGKITDIELLMASMSKEFGHIDILVLNAGSATPGPFSITSEASFDEMLDINFKGGFFTLQKALPLLRQGSSVVVTTSITNQLASPNFSVYGACKAALRALVASLAIELIPMKIRVNAISPGPIATPMFERFGLPVEVSESIKIEIEGKSPIGRFGTPEEVAKAMLFLASDDSSYLVGEEIVVDGGISLL